MFPPADKVYGQEVFRIPPHIRLETRTTPAIVLKEVQPSQKPLHKGQCVRVYLREGILSKFSNLFMEQVIPVYLILSVLIKPCS